MKKNIFILLISIVGLGFFLLNLYTPLLHDDLAYLYKFGPKAEVRPTSVPVENISDVFESIYYHYIDVNGRITPHFLLQLILILGKELFNILNVLVLIGSLFFIFKYSFISGFKDIIAHKIAVFIFLILSYWFLMPFIGQTIFWMTGSINYFWTSFFVIAFLYYLKFYQVKKEIPLYKNILLFIISVCIGCTNESLTIGVAVALFFYSIFNYKKINPTTFFMIVGFWIGVGLIVLAPGTFNRVNNEMVHESLTFKEFLRKKILDLIAIFYLQKYLIAVTFILLVITSIKKVSFNKIFQESFIVLLSIIFNILFVFVVGKIEERVLFGISFLLMIFNVFLIVNILNYVNQKLVLSVLAIFLIGMIYNYGQAYTFLNKYNSEYKQLETRIRSNKSLLNYFPEFSNSRFVYNTLLGISDAKDYHNRVRSFYYNVPEVNIISKELYQEINFGHIFTTKNLLSGWETNRIYIISNYIVIEIPNNYEYEYQIFSDIYYNDKIVKGIKSKLLPIDSKKYIFIELQDDYKDFKKILLKSTKNPNEIIFKFQK